MILFNQNNVEIEYHPETGILEVRWIRILQEHQLSSIWEEIAKYLTKYNLKYLLFDATHIDYVPTMQYEHIELIFKMGLPTSSLEKIAVVVSETVRETSLIEERLAECPKLALYNYQFKLFHHYYEAMDWLLELSKFKI